MRVALLLALVVLDGAVVVGRAAELAALAGTMIVAAREHAGEQLEPVVVLVDERQQRALVRECGAVERA